MPSVNSGLERLELVAHVVITQYVQESVLIHPCMALVLLVVSWGEDPAVNLGLDWILGLYAGGLPRLRFESHAWSGTQLSVPWL